MGVSGIVLSLILLIYLAYRGVSVLVLAPLCALLAILLDGRLPLLATYTQVFMSSVNGAVITLLLICGVTHRQGYLDIGVTTVLCPLAGTLTVLALGTAFGSF